MSTNKRISDQPSKAEQHKKIETAEKIAAGSAIATTTATTTAITTKVAETQSRPFDRSLWNQAFFERDTPLNKMPIVCAHNSGSEQGGGTLFINQNQTMTPYDILSQTPARGLEFQIEDHNGTLITNHGAAMSSAFIDPTASNPETLTSQLDSVNKWLDQPENKNQIVVIQISNQATSPKDQAQISKMLHQKFGNEIFDANDFQRAAYTNGQWPTVNQLTAMNKHVVILSSGMGSNDIYGATIPSSYVMHSEPFFTHPNCPNGMVWEGYGEDRTLAGNLIGQQATSGLPADQQFAGSINTDQMDHYVQQGGLIKLDQLAPNDPRLVDPSKRDQLAMDPNVSVFNGLIQVNRGTASSAVFGVGVITDAGAGSFAIAEILLQTYKNNLFIKNVDAYFTDMLEKTDAVNLYEFKKTKPAKERAAYSNQQALADYCKNELTEKIMKDTAKAGLSGTASLASTVFSAGLLFPVAFPITSILAIAIVAAGLISTAIATFVNRRLLTNNLNQLLATDKMQNRIADKATQLTTVAKEIDKSEYTEILSEKEKDSKLNTASEALLGASLLLRIGSLAKYAISLAGTIAAGFVAATMVIKGTFDAVINYRNRQKHLDDVPKLIQQASQPSIDSKRFILFGETALEKYIKNQKGKLHDKYQLPIEFNSKKPSEVVTLLRDEQYKTQLSAIRKDCMTAAIKEDFDKFCKHSSSPIQSVPDYLLKAYLVHKVGNFIQSDVRTSGRIQSFKLAMATWIGCSFIAPPFAGIFLGVALCVMAVGELVTRLVSHRETRKFTKTAAALIAKSTSGNSDNDPSVTAVTDYMNVLKAALEKQPSKNEQLVKTRVPTSTSTISKVTDSNKLAISPKVASRATLKYPSKPSPTTPSNQESDTAHPSRFKKI